MPMGLSLQVEVYPQAALAELGKSAGLIRHCQTQLQRFFHNQLVLFQPATNNLLPKLISI